MYFAGDKWELQASISELKSLGTRLKSQTISSASKCKENWRPTALKEKIVCASFAFASMQCIRPPDSFNSNSMEQVESFKWMVCLAKECFNNGHFLCTEIRKVRFYTEYVAKNRVAFSWVCCSSVLAYFHSILWMSLQTSFLTIALKYWWILSSCWQVVSALGFTKKPTALSLQEKAREKAWICIFFIFFLPIDLHFTSQEREKQQFVTGLPSHPKVWKNIWRYKYILLPSLT